MRNKYIDLWYKHLSLDPHDAINITNQLMDIVKMDIVLIHNYVINK